MPEIRLDTPADPRVAEYRDVTDAELIHARGIFVAEGRLIVQRVIDDGRSVVRSLLVSDAARRALEPSLAKLDRRVPIYVCAAEDFSQLAGFHVHRGCLALVERPAPLSVDAVLAGARLLVVLEEVGNPDNVGGVFRNAAAFGADGVLLSPGCCDPLYRKAIRTSMAATLATPFARVDPWPEGVAGIRARGFTIVALTPRFPSEPLEEFACRARSDRLALVVGTEGTGLSASLEALADRRVRIPIAPGVESLNLAVATGIALSRLTRLDHLA